MAVFDLFVDEHGTINSDEDSLPYGYGYYLVERGAEADQLRNTLREKFPQGLHLQKLRPQRKVRRVKQVVALLPVSGHFYGGAHVCTDPGYGRNLYFQAVSGQLRNSDTPPADLIARILQAPTGDEGLVDPSKVLPESKGAARLVATYTSVVRVPVVGLMRAEEKPENIELHVHIGEVGRTDKFMSQLRLISDGLTSHWVHGFEEFVREGVIEPVPCHMILEPTKADDDPLFSVADMFAHVAHHYHQSMEEGPAEGTSSLGQELHSAVLPVLRRALWMPDIMRFGTGISCHPPIPQ